MATDETRALVDEINALVEAGTEEIERIRARAAELEEENERLRAKLEDTDRIGRDALRKGGHPAPDDGNAAYAIGWLEARNDREFRATQAQREAAIYGAVIARYGIHLNEAVARRAHKAAERVLTAWRAAQEGGSDG